MFGGEESDGRKRVGEIEMRGFKVFCLGSGVRDLRFRVIRDGIG